MRGVILAGGQGSRLRPLTSCLSKHLLPVYNKPMIYYPLGTLMLAGIRDIQIITTPRDLPQFRELLGDGKNLGVSIEYAVQNTPKGIADGVLLSESFVGSEKLALILGDNIFYGAGVGESLAEFSFKSGATVFTQHVSNPENYGVVRVDTEGKPIEIIEKPKQQIGNLAVTGLYIYDDTVFERARTLRPSGRGELEITDLNNLYLKSNELEVVNLPRGTVWMDTGTVDALADASEFVKVTENRQGLLISSPEEIAWRNGLISDSDLEMLASKMGDNPYSKSILELLN